MYARSTTFRRDPTALDEGIACTRDAVRPAVQQMDGCLGLSMLVDRASGRCIVTTSWDDADALHRSAQAIRGIRETVIPIVRGVAAGTRETGRCDITAVYENRQTRSHAKGQPQAMREEFTEHVGMHALDVSEHDVALPHLPVPETVCGGTRLVTVPR